MITGDNSRINDKHLFFLIKKEQKNTSNRQYAHYKNLPD